MKCAFQNGMGAPSSPSTNGCFEVYLDVDPPVYNNQLSGDLDLEIITVISFSPDCWHGTGDNTQKLFAR